MRIGILTGGGDCPGLNAVIRAVVRRVERDHDGTVLGFRDGWNGVIEDDAIDLDVEACRGLLPRGGTVLGTSRIQPFGVEGGVEACRSTLEARDVDALVVVGGEGTLSCAREMHDDGFPVEPLAEIRARDGLHSKLQAAQAADCADWLPNDLLTKLDRCLMHHGVEGRTPFLDREVAYAGFRLPDSLKLRKGLGKQILRRWLAEHLPEAKPFSRKRGFTVPVGVSWRSVV